MSILDAALTLAAMVIMFALATVLRRVEQVAEEAATGFDDVYTALCDVGDTVADRHCECCTVGDEYPVDLVELEAARGALVRRELELVEIARRELWDRYAVRGVR
jgi:hypothetical protein